MSQDQYLLETHVQKLLDLRTGEAFSQKSHRISLQIKKDFIKLIKPHITFKSLLKDPWLLSILDNPEESFEFKDYLLVSFTGLIEQDNNFREDCLSYYRFSADSRVLRIMRLFEERISLSLQYIKTKTLKQLFFGKVKNSEKFTDKQIDQFLTENEIPEITDNVSEEKKSLLEGHISFVYKNTFSSATFERKQFFGNESDEVVLYPRVVYDENFFRSWLNSHIKCTNSDIDNCVKIIDSILFGCGASNTKVLEISLFLCSTYAVLQIDSAFPFSQKIQEVWQAITYTQDGRYFAQLRIKSDLFTLRI